MSSEIQIEKIVAKSDEDEAKTLVGKLGYLTRHLRTYQLTQPENKKITEYASKQLNHPDTNVEL